MASSISYGNCPFCKEKGVLHMELNCNTGEDEHFCVSCGYTYSYSWIRDNQGNLVRKPVEYVRKDCFLGVSDYNTKEIIFKKPLIEIENLSESIIADWIDYLSCNRKPEDTTPDGFHGVYCTKDGETAKIWYIGDTVEVPTDNEKIIVHEVQIKEETTPGHGIIYICNVSGSGEVHAIPDDMTKQEVIDEVNKIQKENVDKIRGLRATWYNKETKKIEVLFNTFPEEDETDYNGEDEEYDETDGEIDYESNNKKNIVIDNDLPF